MIKYSVQMYCCFFTIYVSFVQTYPYGRCMMLKRMVDFIIAAIMFLFLLPLFILIACLVKGSSRGPIIFKQQRTGYKGLEFSLYKFRTMIDGSGKLHDIVLKGDPRITKIGTFLRSTHLDELPQLWNILMGEMSLVGPRPEPVEDVIIKIKENPSYYLLFHEIKPGLTGPVQLRGRMWRIQIPA